MQFRLQKYDMYVKTVDGVNQKTILGAVITFISTVIVITLLVSEIRLFLKTEFVSRMATDNTSGLEAVELEFDVVLYHIPCKRINFLQEVTRGMIHSHEIHNVLKVPMLNEDTPSDILQPDENIGGCNIRGEIITDKVGGNFRFSIEKESPKENNRPIPVLRDEEPSFSNFSHVIDHIGFIPTNGRFAYSKFSEKPHTLNEQITIIPTDTAIYQYSIQVIPTEYRLINGEIWNANQYSVIEKNINLEQLRKNEAVSGLYLKDFSGIIFTYDFHPVMLIMEERREHISDFIANLIGIIGGVITVLSLFEGFLHQSTKVLLGKKD
eukprot:gene12225-16375_t